MTQIPLGPERVCVQDMIFPHHRQRLNIFPFFSNQLEVLKATKKEKILLAAVSSTKISRKLFDGSKSFIQSSS